MPCLQHETSKGQLVTLLRVAGEPTVDIAVRQVASITFKQAAKRHWEPETEGKQLDVISWSVTACWGDTRTPVVALEGWRPPWHADSPFRRGSMIQVCMHLLQLAAQGSPCRAAACVQVLHAS